MQAVLEKPQVQNIEYKLENLLDMLKSADNTAKNEIENKIVAMGSNVVEMLVNKLPNLKGIQRGVAAMSLIRIGEASIVPLKEHASESKDFQWIANYLISEIKGTSFLAA